MEFLKFINLLIILIHSYELIFQINYLKTYFLIDEHSELFNIF